MQKAKLSWLFILNVFLVITLIISLAKPNSVQSALAGHIVISEVQIGGAGGADDEFVELYNPTGSSVDITGWRLTRKTAGGINESTLANSLSGSISAHGYFLIAPAVDYTGATAPNQNYSTGTRLAADNTVIIYSDAGTTVVDKVALGSALDFETAAFPTNPANGQSVERKANSASTTESMTSGVDVNLGNGEDTNNNSSDFILRESSQPQNASSSAEIPSSSPAPSPSESPSASPSEEPSPSPSTEPSPSPSIEPSPSPSAEPSESPSPSASAEPSASPSISPSPTQSPSPSSTPKPGNKLVCTFKPQVIKFGIWEFTLHFLSCSWNPAI